MFIRQGKEYYPLDFGEITGKNEKKVYDRSERKKSYVYIAVENNEYKGAE